MKRVASLVARLTDRRGLTYSLFVLCLLFQAMVLTRLVVLYHVFKVLFVALVLLLIIAAVRASLKNKALALVILAVVLVRVPFLLHPTGLIGMSDNALEALQSQEIQDSRTVPFYQFEILKHQGTLRYLVVAQTWDIVGPGYVVLILWNLAVFLAVILLLAKVLEPVVSRPAAVFLSLVSFVFIETMFDFSLLIRGGIYLDALFFVLLAMSLFDFGFARKTDLLLSFYFMAFAVYTQPISLIFAGSFLAGVVLFSVMSRRLWRTARLFLAGGFLGLAHVLYYELLFAGRPTAKIPLEEIKVVPLDSVSLRLVGNAFRYAQDAFVNLFRYEFSYFLGVSPPGRTLGALNVLSLVGLWVSLAVLAAGLVIALGRLVGLVRTKTRLEPRHWPYLFFLVLTLGFAVKLAVLLPPRLEPRHNIDLLLLIALAYYFVLTALLRWIKRPAGTLIAFGALLAAFAAPHYYSFFRGAVAKEGSYRGLMTALRQHRVRNVDSDFNLIYPIYYLSGRTIRVTDEVGPFTFRVFYPEMRAEVAARPDADKAFVFYTDAAGTRDWHKRATRKALRETLDRLERAGIRVKVVTLKDHTLLIPRGVRTGPGAEGGES